jgi:hypothetical protein
MQYLLYKSVLPYDSKINGKSGAAEFLRHPQPRRIQGERVIVHRGKKPVAAVVPIEDLDLLEKIEDEIDIAAAREALKEPGTIPWETVKKKLRL